MRHALHKIISFSLLALMGMGFAGEGVHVHALAVGGNPAGHRLFSHDCGENEKHLPLDINEECLPCVRKSHVPLTTPSPVDALRDAEGRIYGVEPPTPACSDLHSTAPPRGPPAILLPTTA